MDKGPDALIDSLLTDIAFSGTRGCSVSALLKAIESFYNDARDEIHHGVEEHHGKRQKPGNANNSTTHPPDALQGRHDSGSYDTTVASKVWRWLVARTDVSVDTNRKFNHLSLDEILAFPEEEELPPSTDNAEESSNQTPTPAQDIQPTSKGRRELGGAAQKYRPRLHVSEDLQWKTLAGHGPDFKRLPLFEWKALVDIASVREQGILQGDLVRLSGQDKRSLPTRTDALAKKGYIIKQPIILRGCRSSKLWLARYSESARVNRDGLNFDKVDLSKEALTKDLGPVPFSNIWNGDKIDYIAIAQTFNAMVKAWGVMRYSDIRAKLDVENRVPQMRALAKTSRWFTGIGAVTFVAAKFSNSQRLYKDCVKFVREPTADEWKVFRTTPTAHIKVPSARLGKRGQASRSKYSNEINFSPHSQAKLKRASDKEHQNQLLNPEELTSPLWTPYKPMVNTTFEIIKRAGSGGSSNGAIVHQTLGGSYRKYIAALAAAISLENSQPPHLNHFEVTGQLNRLGKTMTYQFFATSELDSPSAGREIEDENSNQINTESEVADSPESPNAVASNHTFSQPVSSKFAPVSASMLSQLSGKVQGSRPKRGRKRKNPFLEAEPAKDADGDHGAQHNKKAKTTEPAHADAQAPENNQAAANMGSVATTTPQQPRDNSEVSAPSPHVPPLPVRPPGVYREPDNSLDPPKKKGRRRKSLVLTFKSNALKDPLFFNSMQEIRPEERGEASRQSESSQATPGDDSMTSAKVGAAQISLPPAKRGRKGVFRCDNCGNSWKNPNGLDYHLTKSRTDCNPSYIPPPPPPPPPPPKPRSILKKKGAEEDQIGVAGSSQTSDLAHNSKQHANDGGHRLPTLPSKRARPNKTIERREDNGGLSKPGSIRGSVVLQDVEAYDVIDNQRRRESSQASSIFAYDSLPQLRPTRQVLSQTVPKQLSLGREQEFLPSRGIEKEANTSAAQEIPQAKNQINVIPYVRDGESVPKERPEIGAGAGTETTRPDEQSASKKSRKSSTSTVGTIRRERVTRIIGHLLDNNDGVFPGQKSLYYALVSFWVKNYSDIEPPDWKACQTVVKNMEKAGALFQLHFCFLDENNKLQECCVLAKPKPGETNTADLVTSPKVVIIKEKMREMFPIPYIPEAFSLSEEENKLFNALASSYRDMQQSGGSRRQPQKPSMIEDIEVLQYPSHILGEAGAHVTNPKRRIEEDESVSATPAKRVRIDTTMSPPTQKPRKRSEHWDNGKLAKYIWKKKQKPDEKWDQKPACLQDFATGAWSTLPQETTSSRPEVNVILSSLQKNRHNASTSTRTGSSSRWKGRSEASKKNMDSSEATFWNYDDVDESALANMAKGVNGILMDRFVPPSVSTSFVPEYSESDDEDDVSYTQQDDTSDSSLGSSDEVDIRFTGNEMIQSTSKGSWPSLPASFFESDSSFTMVGNMPDAKWFQRENLPQSAEDVVRSFGGKLQFGCWTDPLYGKFLREVDILEKWEQSAEGSQILLYGSIAPDYIFMSLSPDVSRSNMKPTALEWPSETQYTAANIPDEIKNASPDDENAGLPEITQRGRGRPKRGPKNASRPKQQSENKPAKKPQPAVIAQMEINYKTRHLTAITVQHRGRINKPRPDEDNTGLVGETELIAAFVVIKTLLGGVDRKTDLGLILKTFPGFSHSALKRFWPRVSKERKTYIEALTAKFQSSFLKAYEAGEVAPLNYDDLESYDWKSLITWATKLETHENVNLPESRQAMEKTHSIEKIANEVTDWRETWFHSLASMYSRVEATSADPISIPLNYNAEANEDITSRARSWVRSLCVTPIKGARMPEEIRAKLLRLSGGNETEANKLLKKVVDRLTSDRVAARSKGKILGQSLRLHGVFAKQLERAPTINKFKQAAKFKARLDETFRKGEDFFLPYAANDGSIMAVLNLQANARVHLEPIGIPDIPFGFEPGNYDGRTYPKSYYHFKVKVSPTESYMFDRDLPVLQQAIRMEAPQHGPRDMIPIWVDFFGNLNMDRWITYLSMMVMALATKGPLTPETASVLMKPFVEPFEAKLIMDWVDSLGILQRYESEQSATVGEWWWLVAGKIVMNVKGDGLPQGQK
ncbi:hypothetical protein F4820DRAFT_435897 [Hypoxylon rubiginosum]|uniref:Uncharacterized protein n=1 Tax=Hypoxylon rubiginosum TaxID=110542 RepID=A0ACB9YNG1_9PEZI|nr:hypothetical protein F4820DRAFT_435897 [Hypoxylon rubiginosum]